MKITRHSFTSLAMLPLLLTLLSPVTAFGQGSPSQTASVTIDGKAVSIRYSAPSVRGRTIFGPNGILSQDPTYPVWRAGANAATSFHTDADLDINGLMVPKGDYTLYALIQDPDNWKLVVNKEKGQWGLTYNASLDLGRVGMTMSKPAALVEMYKITLSATGPKAGQLKLEWEHHIATVNFTIK
ncbi:MAG: DUF2911 domain-containing protein [Acidobacteriota bacterium]